MKAGRDVGAVDKGKKANRGDKEALKLQTEKRGSVCIQMRQIK